MKDETCYQCGQPAITMMRAGKGFPDVDVPFCAAHAMQRKAAWALGTESFTMSSAPGEGVIPQGQIVEAFDATDSNDSNNTVRVVRVESGAIHVI